jgi:hypothetical protein
MCLFACCSCCVLLADGVNELENEDVRGECHEFHADDPDCWQEFAADADGGKSSLFPFDAC